MRSISFTTGLQLLFTPAALFPFLLGSIALAVLGNAVYQLLTNWLGASTHAVCFILAGAVLIVVVTALFLGYLIHRARRAAPQIERRSPEPHQGLILLVSAEVVCRKAIEHHRPALKHCWLVHSDDPRSADVAKKLRDELQPRLDECELRRIKDVYNPCEILDTIHEIYRRRPGSLRESDIILDFTGMTGCASVGAVMACLGDERPLQYTPGRYNAALQAMEPLPPIEMLLDWNVVHAVIGEPQGQEQTTAAAGAEP